MTGFGCHIMVRRSDGGDGGFCGATGGRALSLTVVVASGGHGCVHVDCSVVEWPRTSSRTREQERKSEKRL